MNTLFLCCCKCQLISEFLELLKHVTWPVCIAIIVAAIAKSSALTQWIRSYYDHKATDTDSNKDEKKDNKK